MARHVTEYVKYKKCNADRHSRPKKLVQMPRGERPFADVEMDFGGGLPESECYNTILVVTDWFDKVQYYILAKTTCTMEEVADSDINNNW